MRLQSALVHNGSGDTSSFTGSKNRVDDLLGPIPEHLVCESEHYIAVGNSLVVTQTVSLHVGATRVPSSSVSFHDDPPNRDAHRRLPNMRREPGVGENLVQQTLELGGRRLVGIGEAKSHDRPQPADPTRAVIGHDHLCQFPDRTGFPCDQMIDESLQAIRIQLGREGQGQNRFQDHAGLGGQFPVL